MSMSVEWSLLRFVSVSVKVRTLEVEEHESYFTTYTHKLWVMAYGIGIMWT